MTPPGQDTNPSQVSPQQKLVLICTAESTGVSRVKCLSQGHNTVLRPRFKLTPLVYESDMLATRPLRCSLRIAL